MKNSKYIFFCVALLSLNLMRCSKSTTDDGEESGSEAVVGAMSAAAASAEGTSLAFIAPSKKTTLSASIEKIFNLLPTAYASTVCPRIKAATCSGGAFTLTYADCTKLAISTPVWGAQGGGSGSETFTFDSQATCNTFTTAGTHPGSGTVTRTFGGVIPTNGTTVTYSNRKGVSFTVAHDTTTATGYDSAVYAPQDAGVTNAALSASASGVKPSGGIFVKFSAASGTRTVEMLGTNKVGYNSSGTKVFDHTFSTLNGAPLTMTGLAATRQVTGGTVIFQHNLAKFTATTSIVTALAYTDIACCHPATGSVQLTYTGSKTGTETISFGSCSVSGGTATGCGAATLTATDGSQSCLKVVSCI